MGDLTPNWGHRVSSARQRGEPEQCIVENQPWPCDAEQMRLERDVRISGPRQDPTVEIFNPDGSLYKRGEHVTVGFVEEFLP